MGSGPITPDIPTTKRGEESGIFPRLSPTLERGVVGSSFPHTWGRPFDEGSRGAHLARPCQVQVVPPTSCRDTPEWLNGPHGVMTVRERMLVDRPSPHPTVRGLENNPNSLPVPCVASLLGLFSSYFFSVRITCCCFFSSFLESLAFSHFQYGGRQDRRPPRVGAHPRP